MAPSMNQAIKISIVLMVTAIVLPFGLGYMGNIGDTVVNGSALDTILDPSVITLLEILIPILAVVGIAMTFISASRNN